MMTLANLSNGLAYPHDHIAHFQSNYAHHKSLGYFRIDSMPLEAIVHLLNGGEVTIVDATASDKALSDGLKKGVPTWCLVFNRAIDKVGVSGARSVRVCEWQTRDMVQVAHSQFHHPATQTIRKLAKVVGATGPAVIGQNIHLVCHRLVGFDDKPDRLAELVQMPYTGVQGKAGRALPGGT